MEDNSLNEKLAQQISTVERAAAAVKSAKTPAEAKSILINDFGAVFEENGRNFSLFDGTFKAALQGERGVVGTQGKIARRAARKAERQARKQARRGR